MNFTRATHLLAMDMATLADISKGKGLVQDAKEFYMRAFELEKKAANMIITTESDIDSHFILIRSAASLALTAGLFEDGKQLIKTSLLKKPPLWIIKELKEVLVLIENAYKNASKTKRVLQFNGVVTDVNSSNFEIILQDDNDHQSFAILVPKNQFIEVVKKYWLHKVKIKAKQTNQGIFLLNQISAA